MTVYIQLTTAGSSVGPFNLYSDVDGFSTPFEINVSREDLQNGYTSILVPNYTLIIRVLSTDLCTNYIDIPVVENTTTTTTTLA